MYVVCRMDLKQDWTLESSFEVIRNNVLHNRQILLYPYALKQDNSLDATPVLEI